VQPLLHTGGLQPLVQGFPTFLGHEHLFLNVFSRIPILCRINISA